jgi:hypothetical protein
MIDLQRITIGANILAKSICRRHVLSRPSAETMNWEMRQEHGAHGRAGSFAMRVVYRRADELVG